jgi:shikimate dehydrogenase
VVAGCHQLGCGNIHVFGRDGLKLAKFGESWQDIELVTIDRDTPTPVKISTHLWANLAEFTDRNNLLLVNSTPIGMYPHVDASPIDREIFEKIGINSIAYDLIYTPRPTKFLSLATECGLQAIDGTEMLVQQGAIAFELWLKQAPPVDIMREIVLKYLA